MQRRSFLCATLATAAVLPVTVSGASTSAPVSPLRVLVYGDSNTWGLRPVPVDGEFVRYPEAQRWTSVLQRSLGAGFDVRPGGMMLRTFDSDLPTGAFGLDGQDFNGRRRLPMALLTESPIHLVVVMLGTNDLIASLERAPDEIAAGVAGYAAIAASATESHPRVTGPRVLLLAPPPLGDVSRGGFAEDFDAGSLARSKRLATVMGERAAAAGIVFADAGEWIHSDGIDGVHLSEAMHRRLGEGVAKRVRAMTTP